MLTAIEEDPEAFSSNWSVSHGHTSTIQSIAFSNSGRFFITLGHNEVKFWQMQNSREAHVYTTLKL
jgi:WD40 repeat protein